MTSPHWSQQLQQQQQSQENHHNHSPPTAALISSSSSSSTSAFGPIAAPRPLTGSGGNNSSSSPHHHHHQHGTYSSSSILSRVTAAGSSTASAGGSGGSDRAVTRHSPITTWNNHMNNSNSSSSSYNHNHHSNNHNSSGNHMSNGFSPPGNDSGAGGAAGSGSGSSSNAFREAGIVEKLLPSYGFIQCCERQARLFFHYSQFNGNIEHLKLGDPVEFEMTYDRRTGKPIASTVAKISNEVFPVEDVTNPDQPGQTANGFITTEPLPGKDGRVAYENRGECFFLPFTLDDVEPGTGFLRSNDKVSFRIATDKSGNLRARKLTLLTNTPDRFQGIVCTLKDSFGFIERADIVKEIFFHSSECQDFKSLNLGDDVEFGIQTRNDKKVAVDVRPLSPGTVVFEHVSEERVNGVVMKMATRAHNSFGRQQYSNSPAASSSSSSMSGPMLGLSTCESGIIRVISDRLNEDICFAIKDINGEFTLKEGDIVTCNIVTDKRDDMKHAGKIELHPECFKRLGEQRDNGYVASLKDNYGFIKCFNREGTRVYFKISELLNPNLLININDEVEFTLSPDVSSPGRFQAIRIAILPNGTLMKSVLARGPSYPGSSTMEKDKYNYPYGQQTSMSSSSTVSNSHNQMLDYPLIDLDGDDSSNSNNPHNNMGSQMSNGGGNRFSSNAVRSDTWTDILSQIQIEINSQPSSATGAGGLSLNDLLTSEPSFSSSASDQFALSSSSADPVNGNHNNKSTSHGRGFIAAVKDSYGFIESEDHQNEVFFHFSVFEGNSNDLELGHDVEFLFTIKNDRMSAEWAKLLPRKTIPRETVISPDQSGAVVNGTVIRTCRCLNPEQEAYPGLVKIVPESPDSPDSADAAAATAVAVSNHQSGEKVIEFSMTSLSDVREFIQKGDSVSFQIGMCPITGKERAVNLRIIRNKRQATIDTIKSNYGFINFDAADDGKKLFFHMSEYKGNDPDDLRPGDRVEFAVVHNQRTNKYSACSLTKCDTGPRVPRQRPEHLISRLKLTMASDQLSNKIIAIRQPKGPDGTKGFAPRAPVPSSNGAAAAPVIAAASQ